MAKQSRPQPSADPPDEILQPDDAAERITQFFDALGADSSVAVSIYEVDPKNRLRRGFLFQLPDVRELSGAELMTEVLEKYGPGEYIAEGRTTAGTIAFNARFCVGSVKSPSKVPDPRSPASSSAPPELLAMLERNTRALEALAAHKPPSAVELLQQLGSMRELFAPREERKDVLTVARELAEVKALFSQPEQPLDKVIGMIRDLLEVKDTLAGDQAADASPIAAALKSLAPSITRVLDRFVPEQPAPQPAVAVAGTGNAVTPGDGKPKNGNGAVSTGGWFAPLLEAAAGNVPPPEAAARVLEHLAAGPAWVEQAVLGLIVEERGAAVERLIAMEPRFVAYRTWLEVVVRETLTLLESAEVGPEHKPPATPPPGAAT